MFSYDKLQGKINSMREHRDESINIVLALDINIQRMSLKSKQAQFTAP